MFVCATERCTVVEQRLTPWKNHTVIEWALPLILIPDHMSLGATVLPIDNDTSTMDAKRRDDAGGNRWRYVLQPSVKTATTGSLKRIFELIF